MVRVSLLREYLKGSEPFPKFADLSVNALEVRLKEFL